ncbi:hypothetical protein [Rhodococcus opacus]|uniref:hypothetical protein n=1 Tax=Rhodococcus opacus TaxID=37919 RepID=UPI001F588B31|nr:hypothetical protein [Rhodococcus opacus]UNN05170.1 hypothetical protein MOO23_40375 [Rhodococcus opacus]
MKKGRLGMGEQEDTERVRDWIARLEAFASALDEIEGEGAIDFCDNVCDAWQGIVTSSTPSKTSPAVLIALEPLIALMKVMTTATMDWADTPDVRDRLTRNDVQRLAKDALDDILHGYQRWSSEGIPSPDQIQQRISTVEAEMNEAQAIVATRNADFEEQDAAAEADPYGAILGYHDPNLDAKVIFTKVSSFTEQENERYQDAFGRLRRMIDSELFRHISDEHDVLCDLLMGIVRDLQDNTFSITDEDAMDERRRKLRSALISFTSALQIHEDQTVRAARNTFGRNTPEVKAVQALFNDLKSTSFEYRWLAELRDALQHGDINAFNYDFTAQMHGEPAVNVYMDRQYMLEFTREARKKPWLNRSQLEAMTSDPSVIDMIKAIQPQMGDLQDELDKIIYPHVADDVATIRQLIGRFNGRRGMYCLQTGPGFTRRLGIPPFTRLAPRVLHFADTYQIGSG